MFPHYGIKRPGRDFGHFQQVTEFEVFGILTCVVFGHHIFGGKI